MQTINVTYLPAGNVKDARLKAQASGGESVTIPFPYELDSPFVSWEAAKALRAKLGWTGPMIGGASPNGMVFVFKNDQEYPLTAECALANRITS